MIGVKFLIPNKWDCFFNKILENTNTDNYKWIIEDGEILLSSEKSINNNYLYSDKEFRSIIKKECYPIFADIKLYKEYNGYSTEKYEDYLKNDCILAIFITDNTFVRVYSKNINILQNIINNAIKYEYSNIEYIYANDPNISNNFTAY